MVIAEPLNELVLEMPINTSLIKMELPLSFIAFMLEVRVSGASRHFIAGHLEDSYPVGKKQIIVQNIKFCTLDLLNITVKFIVMYICAVHSPTTNIRLNAFGQRDFCKKCALHFLSLPLKI